MNFDNDSKCILCREMPCICDELYDVDHGSFDTESGDTESGFRIVLTITCISMWLLVFCCLFASIILGYYIIKHIS